MTNNINRRLQVTLGHLQPHVNDTVLLGANATNANQPHVNFFLREISFLEI
jgi:hypothetical protein